MALKDLQRRMVQTGRIRLGIKVPTGNGKSRPEKLTTFRFTSRSETSIRGVAELFGGDVRPWEGMPGEWEVVTEAKRIPVSIPPGDGVISQWYEMWTGGGCARRCDGLAEQLSGGKCLCPSDQAQRDALASRGEACKPVTRLSVIIPDAPGLGVWRLDSHGWNAAHDLGNIADFLQAVRDRNGVYVPAYLRLDERKTVKGGRTNRFVVPMLEPMATMREIAAMEPGNVLLGLPPAPVNAKAITAAGASEDEPGKPAVEAPAAWKGPAEPAEATAAEVAEVVPDAANTPPTGVTVPRDPGELARLARDNSGKADPLRWLWKYAAEQMWLDEWVAPSDDPEAAWVTVRDLITALGPAKKETSK